MSYSNSINFNVPGNANMINNTNTNKNNTAINANKMNNTLNKNNSYAGNQTKSAGKSRAVSIPLTNLYQSRPLYNAQPSTLASNGYYKPYTPILPTKRHLEDTESDDFQHDTSKRPKGLQLPPHYSIPLADQRVQPTSAPIPQPQSNWDDSQFRISEMVWVPVFLNIVEERQFINVSTELDSFDVQPYKQGFQYWPAIVQNIYSIPYREVLSTPLY